MKLAAFTLIFLAKYIAVCSEKFQVHLEIQKQIAENDKILIVRTWRQMGSGTCSVHSSAPNRIYADSTAVYTYNAENNIGTIPLAIIDNDSAGDDTKVKITLECVCEMSSRTVKFEKEISLLDNDATNYYSPLQVLLEFTPRVYLGMNVPIILRKIQGSGECLLKLSDSAYVSLNATENEAIPLTGFTFYHQTMVIAQINDDLKEETTVVLEIRCFDFKNRKSMKFFQYITVIPFDLTKIFTEFRPLVEIPLEISEDGGVQGVLVKRFVGEGTCDADINSKKYAYLVGSTSYVFKGQTAVTMNGNFILVKPVDDDASTANRIVTIDLMCLDSNKKPIPNMSTYILIEEDDLFGSSLSKDPHFFQNIFDKVEMMDRKICYDVTGKSGDLINIIEHKRTKTTLFGELLDDYYMHVVTVISQYGNITITTKEIEIPGGLTILWNESSTKDEKVSDGNYDYTLYKNTIKINVKAVTETLKFVIQRTPHLGNGYYLDASVIGLKRNYNGYGGILGTVGNNEFIFSESVQESSNKASIKVNGKWYSSSIIKRENERCWLVDIESALYPFPLEDFIFPKSS